MVYVGLVLFAASRIAGGDAFHLNNRQPQNRGRGNIPGNLQDPNPQSRCCDVKDTFDSCDRRSFVGQILASLMVGSGIGMPQNALAAAAAAAASYPQEAEDKQKIKKGYERLTYLLDNWVAETTICGKSDDNPYTGTRGCERNPLIVMDYMGYKSISDPLFKADKTLKRLSVLVSDKYGADYLDAMEKWAEAAEEASGMAYISSWGEANPGGGKDRVELFIERAKKNVQDAHDSLGTAIQILGI